MTKEERAKEACEYCSAGIPKKLWLDEWTHSWVRKTGPASSSFSMTICRADKIWKEPDNV